MSTAARVPFGILEGTMILKYFRLYADLSGESREKRVGDVWHMEDRGGHGHHTKVTSESDFEAAIIQYE